MKSLLVSEFDAYLKNYEDITATKEYEEIRDRLRIVQKNGIHTHFVEELSDRETVVRAVKIVPLEIIIRNVAAGSFSKRYGVEEGRELLRPTLEFSLKDDALNDPLINDSHIIALGVATESELESIRNMAYKDKFVIVLEGLMDKTRV